MFCTTKVSLALVARLVQEQFSQAKIFVQVAGGGKMPAKKNVDFTFINNN